MPFFRKFLHLERVSLKHLSEYEFFRVYKFLYYTVGVLRSRKVAGPEKSQLQTLFLSDTQVVQCINVNFRERYKRVSL